MDSNSPNYAKWIPEAGGYVHNGSVISKTPIYGENGLQEVDVDISKLAQPTVGATQQNQAGSGQDVNAAVVGVGSLASLNNNTANTEYGPLNTPATQSQVAEGPVLSPVDQIMKDIEYGTATNNLKMQIDGYTKLGQIQNADYSQIINNLNQQRNQKIIDTDNAYHQAIVDAYTSGDNEGAASLMQAQADWRNQVGFGDAIQTEYQTKQQDIQIEYESAYMDGINDIVGGLMNMVGNYLNFQYDPTQDRALQVAQGYAVGAVKEQMNHTGMYYSSMTQNAITRAVAELVPVYEKMAKEELKNNISMLQSTANFLMNLEQTQFNLWRGQIQLQWDTNEEKRKEYNAAMDRANAWGYVSNEDAVILGVAPGSPSPKAIADAKAAQAKLDEEQRELYSKLALEDYKNTLDLQKMYAELEAKDYYDQLKAQRDYQYDSALSRQKYNQDYNLKLLNNNGSGSGSGNKANSQKLKELGISDDTISTLEDIIAGNKTKAETIKFFEDTFKTNKQIAEVGAQAMFANDPLGASYFSNANTVNNEIASQYIDAMNQEIDEIVQDKFNNDYGVTKPAFDEALKKANEIASIFSQSKVPNWETYAALPYQHLIDKIEIATEFDNSWGNILDDYTEMKGNAMKDIVNAVKKDKSLGSGVAKIIQEHADEIHDASKVNRRDTFIDNTLRVYGDMGGAVLNTGTNAINAALDNAKPYIEKATEIGNKIDKSIPTPIKAGVTGAAKGVIGSGIRTQFPTLPII